MLQRQTTSISDFLLLHIRKCSFFLYFEGVKNLSEEQLLDGLSYNADISGVAMVELAVVKAGVTVRLP